MAIVKFMHGEYGKGEMRGSPVDVFFNEDGTLYFMESNSRYGEPKVLWERVRVLENGLKMAEEELRKIDRKTAAKFREVEYKQEVDNKQKDRSYFSRRIEEIESRRWNGYDGEWHNCYHTIPDTNLVDFVYNEAKKMEDIWTWDSKRGKLVRKDSIEEMEI